MERKVDMVRIPRQEEVYEREAIFGRDVSSVFPSQAKEAADATAASSADAIKEMLGARNFISESELEKIKASRGASVEDGTIAPQKPLAEILREAKERKNAEFQEVWKSMKTGKNRPLDTEELEFLDQLAQQEAQQLRQWSEQESRELEEFRRAVQSATGADVEADAAAAPKVLLAQAIKPPPKPLGPAPSQAKPVLKPIVKVKPKGGEKGTSAGAPSSKQGSASDGARRPDVAATAVGPAAKRQKTDSKEDVKSTSQPSSDLDEGEGEGLVGLLGGYGTDDDT
eukprot:CAMPEP_0202896432 /NCGR_PEP_ID=MMETSP1392-20130828/5446_1 /ASSEMBLY_ACC=CAM_ASM_000868 /TAXON_ID=225041 /ORGANISM="Chlamydomonas chlamydogama, Strain SAG 11-48b" /LENGTH=283 /DNA_ID=CAMNT_0049581795 /DNA_START=59 /DNA_END=913 /DNA_ORIENTATION=+